MGLAQAVSKFFLVYETYIVFYICLFFTRFTSMNMASDFFSKTASWRISGAIVRLAWRQAAGVLNISLID